jgi:hypothetical protein
MGRRDWEPYAGTAQKLLHSACKFGEGRIQYGSTGDKNKIPSRHNPVVYQPNRFACASLGTVPIMRLADTLADDKATPGTPCAVFGYVQHKQRMCPCFSFAAHASELFRAAQSLVTTHLPPFSPRL